MSDKLLKLKTGQPSLVLLHLQKTKRAMTYLTKHIRVDSKMNDDIKPAQKNNNFEVHLSHPIDLNAKFSFTSLAKNKTCNVLFASYLHCLTHLHRLKNE